MNIDELLNCPICCDYFQIVSETPCCHGLYCQSCLVDWARTNLSCPSCRERLNVSQCKQNIPIQRFVENIPLDCPYKLNGCSAKPPRSELEKHKLLCAFSPAKIQEQSQKKKEEFANKRKYIEELKTKYQNSSLDTSDALLLELLHQIYTLANSLLMVAEYGDAEELVIMGLELLKNHRTKESQQLQLELAEFLNLQGLIYKSNAKYSEAIKRFTEGLTIVEKQLNKEKQMEYLINMGDTLLKEAKFEEATTKYNEALEISKTCLGLASSKTGEILNAIGLVAKKCSEYDKAIQAYTDAVKIVSEDSSLWSEIVLNLADVHRKKGNYTEARDLYLKSRTKFESMFGTNHPQIGEVCNALGMLAKKEAKYGEALDYYKTALKIARHFFGDSHPSVGIYLTNLGDIHRKKGDFKGAEAMYMKAISMLEKSLGPQHVEVAEVLNSMGLVLKKRASYDEAEEHYRRAIAIIQTTFGAKHYKYGIYMNNLGDVQRKRGNYEEALAIYKKALDAIEKTLGHSHEEAAEILHNIGLVQHQLTNYKEAISLYNTALQIVRKQFGEKHYKVGMYLNNSGLAYAMLDQYESAYEQLKQALQILIFCLGVDHIEVADCYTNLGDVCMKLQAEGNTTGKLEEAKKYYQKAKAIVEKTFGPEHTKSKQLESLLFICDCYDDLTA